MEQMFELSLEKLLTKFGKFTFLTGRCLTLPDFVNNFSGDNSNICSIEGTNVIRVPFGKKFSKKKRPEKNQNIATLILPLSSYSSPTPPHVA